MTTTNEAPTVKVDKRTKKGKAAVSSTIDKSQYGIPFSEWMDMHGGGTIDMPMQVEQTTGLGDDLHTFYKTQIVQEAAHRVRLPAGLTEPKVVAAAVENLAVAVGIAAEMRERIYASRKDIPEAQAADAEALKLILKTDPYAMFGSEDTPFEPPHAATDAATARLANAEKLVAMADAQATVAYGTIVGAIDVVSDKWIADLRKEIEVSRNIIAGKVYALEIQSEALTRTIGLYEMLVRMKTGVDRRPMFAENPSPTLAPLKDAIAGLGPFVRETLGAIVEPPTTTTENDTTSEAEGPSDTENGETK